MKMETKFISIDSGECSQNETIFFETKEDQEIFIEDDTMVGNGLFARELLKIARNNLKALTEEKEIIIHDLGSTNIYRDKMKHLKIYAVVRTKEDWLKFCLDYDGSPSKCRVTGACKTWKRTPEKFKLPVKRGLYEYFYISENNGNQWDFSK